MLKALELYGFKSFADRTRFEFPEGITVVVGPNGSGKSNIVDGIKWVLGEQSAKSLRGKDMSDVIFKGSGQSGRKVMNTAEATLILDNADRKLEIDAPEVHVTRRVYRSGEGEYLINGQPVRLRDIKDLFRGTGVGADAYSLIEQGKVDKLLQAGAKDRRAIFEEAAGISRFKAKKIEAQRRLERVDQNLLRLSDIVEEVENRLRNVRSQATKARRYREYSERLQQLRTDVGRTDWRRLTDRLDEIEAELLQANEQVDSANAEIESVEVKILDTDTDAIGLGESIRMEEAKSARNREQIASLESQIQHQRTLAAELESDGAVRRRQLAAISGKAGDLHIQVRDAHQQADDAADARDDARTRLDDLNAARTASVASLEQLRQQIEQMRQQYLETMRESTGLSNRVSSRKSEMAALESTTERCQDRLDETTKALDAAQDELAVVEVQEAEIDSQLLDVADRLEAAQVELTENRRLVARRQEEIAVVQGQSSGVTHRIDVLVDLEQKLEGLPSGVKETLRCWQEGKAGFEGVHGLVGDVIDAKVELASLVDAALGDAAHYIIIEDEGLVDAMHSGELASSGRVGFVPLDFPALPHALERLDFSREPGVLGRADRLVSTAAQYKSLVSGLLGSVWFVDNLAIARRLADAAPRGMVFITLDAEVVASHGALFIGPRQTAGDLVSRRAELRSLQQERQNLEQRAAQFRRELARLQENIDLQEVAARKLGDEHKELNGSIADLRVQTRSLKNRRDHTQKIHDAAAAEQNAAQTQYEEAKGDLEDAQAKFTALAQVLTSEEQAIGDAEQQLEQEDDAHECLAQEATTAEVEFARLDQRADATKTQLLRFEADQRERDRAVVEARSQMDAGIARLAELNRGILDATSEIAILYVLKEHVAAEIEQATATREAKTAERNELQQAQQQLRQRLRKDETRSHELQLSAGDLRHQRATLAERLRDDYGIDVSQWEAERESDNEEQQQQREEIEEEIQSLRRKLNNIGAVNMEALGELDDLENRFGKLSTQYQDLIDAKESLQRIIHKINGDSRRLFAETLEAIRVNFQTLYRKAFGGGKADIVLEEGVDILEAGIEINATPPGKPSFNNSLLSGGEKALTAVALLLAIFQFRPSPFCVLDEVDAPFDEANIGRFVDVLKDFLGWTRFVIVTHSKKTMTAATTLYGVTMQESGVSKQVSVRFEDVSDDGQISADAINRTDDDGQAA